MFGIGHWELIILLLVILLVFGAKRIPEMAQGLGKGIREFRKAMHEVRSEIDVNAPPEPAPPSQLSTADQSVAQQPVGPPEQAASSGKTPLSNDHST
jgi:sec-independent protein translocase protein TatA